MSEITEQWLKSAGFYEHTDGPDLEYVREGLVLYRDGQEDWWIAVDGGFGKRVAGCSSSAASPEPQQTQEHVIALCYSLGVPLNLKD